MVQKNRHMSKKIDIISLYLSDYSLYFSGREIGRLVKINHQTAMNLLSNLVKEKVLKIVKKGRSNLYYLNIDDFECVHYIMIAEVLKSKNALSNIELKLVIEKILYLCETVIVFGSFASGKQKDSSDIDLIVISPKSKNKIQEEVKIFPREINIEYVSWNSFAKSLSKRNHLAIEIKKNHLVYGNVHKLVEIYVNYQK